MKAVKEYLLSLLPVTERAVGFALLVVLPAYPLAFIVWAYSLAGFDVALAIATPIAAAYCFGRFTARDRMIREHDEKLAELKARVDAEWGIDR